jgi:proline iminopeptidase
MTSRLSILVACLCACGSSTPAAVDAPRSEPAPPTEGQFQGDGVSLYYRIAGRGRETLVMIHGGPGMDSGYMVADFAPLEERHRLLYYDQRGGGRSARPGQDPSLYTMERHVADLEALRVHFKLERMTLVAHSYGPALAASYAMTHPDRVARMILIGPLPPRLGDLWARYTVTLESQLTAEEKKRMAELGTAMSKGPDPVAACRAFWVIGIKARVARPELASKVKGEFCGAGVEGIRHGYGVAGPHTLTGLGEWDFRSGLAAVRAPVLVIHGEAEAIPMDLVEEWTTALPNARLVKIAGASHFPYVERPDLVWPVIEEFLAQPVR